MEAEPRIEADCKLEFRDFYHAMRWRSWRNGWWVYGLLIFIFGAVILRTSFEAEPGHFTNQLMKNLPDLIFPIFLAGLLYGNVYWGAHRQFKTNNSLRQTRHYVFSTEGLDNSSPTSSGKLDWSVLHKVIETPESFLFFGSSASYGVFPKRSLKNEEQIQALRSLIRERVGTKAKLRKT
jgi:hypothetical protein